MKLNFTTTTTTTKKNEMHKQFSAGKYFVIIYLTYTNAKWLLSCIYLSIKKRKTNYPRAIRFCVDAARRIPHDWQSKRKRTTLDCVLFNDVLIPSNASFRLCSRRVRVVQSKSRVFIFFLHTNTYERHSQSYTNTRHLDVFIVKVFFFYLVSHCWTCWHCVCVSNAFALGTPLVLDSMIIIMALEP